MFLKLFSKKEVKQQMDSEEYKKIMDKIKELSRDLANLEIDHNLLRTMLKKAITSKAIIKTPEENPKETEQEQPKRINNMHYY